MFTLCYYRWAQSIDLLHYTEVFTAKSFLESQKSLAIDLLKNDEIFEILGKK